MDIHLDRWLEHNPTPPDMPDGEGVSYLAMLGSDLRRVWWGAWGDPRGFVPRMADYFKLCNIAKSDAQRARSDRRAARAASSSVRGSACGARARGCYVPGRGLPRRASGDSDAS